jgi:hypothetical protein
MRVGALIESMRDPALPRSATRGSAGNSNDTV